METLTEADVRKYRHRYDKAISSPALYPGIVDLDKNLDVHHDVISSGQWKAAYDTELRELAEGKARTLSWSKKAQLGEHERSILNLQRTVSFEAALTVLAEAQKARHALAAEVNASGPLTAEQKSLLHTFSDQNGLPFTQMDVMAAGAEIEDDYSSDYDPDLINRARMSSSTSSSSTDSPPRKKRKKRKKERRTSSFSESRVDDDYKALGMDYTGLDTLPQAAPLQPDHPLYVPKSHGKMKRIPRPDRRRAWFDSLRREDRQWFDFNAVEIISKEEARKLKMPVLRCHRVYTYKRHKPEGSRRNVGP